MKIGAANVCTYSVKFPQMTTRKASGEVKFPQMTTRRALGESAAHVERKLQLEMEEHNHQVLRSTKGEILI